MVKDQEFLEKKASYCLGLAKKLGATESSVIVNNSVSGNELNSSSGVFFVASTHFSIKMFRLSSSKLDEDIDDFFFPMYVVMPIPRSSDLLDSSSFLFLKLTVSDTELLTITLDSVSYTHLTLPTTERV